MFHQLSLTGSVLPLCSASQPKTHRPPDRYTQYGSPSIFRGHLTLYLSFSHSPLYNTAMCANDISCEHRFSSLTEFIQTVYPLHKSICIQFLHTLLSYQKNISITFSLQKTALYNRKWKVRKT
mgnify:CR=1 FL=1